MPILAKKNWVLLRATQRCPTCDQGCYGWAAAKLPGAHVELLHDLLIHGSLQHAGVTPKEVSFFFCTCLSYLGDTAMWLHDFHGCTITETTVSSIKHDVLEISCRQQSLSRADKPNNTCCMGRQGPVVGIVASPLKLPGSNSFGGLSRLAVKTDPSYPLVNIHKTIEHGHL